METLDQIAIRTGTDKNSNCHNYCNYYEQFFAHLRDQPIKLLELGVYHGDSLRMWADYFVNGLIYGVDIEDMSQHNNSRIQTFIYDQSSFTQLRQLSDSLPSMNIIVDDASHQSADQILSFLNLFQMVAPSGYYVIEDILCAFFPQWNKGGSTIALVKSLIDKVQMGGHVDQNWLCSNKKTERLKYEGLLDYFEREVEWVFNSCGLVIIKKL